MPTAEQAALMNAQYRAANNLPVDNINTLILSTRQGQAYTDHMDAANEAAKYQAAFSQPRNDIPVENSSRYNEIISQYESSRNRVVTAGGSVYQGKVSPSTNPYPEGTAASIAWEVNKSGGVQNPYLANTASAYGMDAGTLNVRTEDNRVVPLTDVYSGKETKTAWGRDTVATRDLSSDISRGDYGGYVPSETGKTYYKQGAGQVGIQGDTFMNTESGAVTTFSTDLGDRRILNIRGGSSIFGAQSGTISTKPSSSLIYESDFAHYEKGDPRRYSKESTGDFLGVEANPFAYSRPGAEAYGGMGGISLDGRTIKADAPITSYGSKGSKDSWWSKTIENREKVAKANTAENPLTLSALGGLGLADVNTFITTKSGTQRSRYAADSGNLANWVSPSGLDYVKGDDASRSKQNAVTKDGVLTVDKNYGYDTSNVLSGLLRGNDRAGFVSNEAPTKLSRVTTYTPPEKGSGRVFGDLSSMMVEVPNPRYGVTKTPEPEVVTKPTVYGAAARDIISAGWGEKNVRASATNKKTAGSDLGPGRFVPTATGAGIMGAGIAEPSAGERGPLGAGFEMATLVKTQDRFLSSGPDVTRTGGADLQKNTAGPDLGPGRFVSTATQKQQNRVVLTPLGKVEGTKTTAADIADIFALQPTYTKSESWVGGLPVFGGIAAAIPGVESYQVQNFPTSKMEKGTFFGNIANDAAVTLKTEYTRGAPITVDMNLASKRGGVEYSGRFIGADGKSTTTMDFAVGKPTTTYGPPTTKREYTSEGRVDTTTTPSTTTQNYQTVDLSKRTVVPIYAKTTVSSDSTFGQFEKGLVGATYGRILPEHIHVTKAMNPFRNPLEPAYDPKAKPEGFVDNFADAAYGYVRNKPFSLAGDVALGVGTGAVFGYLGEGFAYGAEAASKAPAGSKIARVATGATYVNEKILPAAFYGMIGVDFVGTSTAWGSDLNPSHIGERGGQKMVQTAGFLKGVQYGSGVPNMIHGVKTTTTTSYTKIDPTMVSSGGLFEPTGRISKSTGLPETTPQTLEQVASGGLWRTTPYKGEMVTETTTSRVGGIFGEGGYYQQGKAYAKDAYTSAMTPRVRSNPEPYRTLFTKEGKSYQNPDWVRWSKETNPASRWRRFSNEDAVMSFFGGAGSSAIPRPIEMPSASTTGSTIGAPKALQDFWGGNGFESVGSPKSLTARSRPQVPRSSVEYSAEGMSNFIGREVITNVRTSATPVKNPRTVSGYATNPFAYSTPVDEMRQIGISSSAPLTQSRSASSYTENTLSLAAGGARSNVMSRAAESFSVLSKATESSSVRSRASDMAYNPTGILAGFMGTTTGSRARSNNMVSPRVSEMPYISSRATSFTYSRSVESPRTTVTTGTKATTDTWTNTTTGGRVVDIPPVIPGWPNWPGGSGGYSGGSRRGRGANRETIGIRSSLEELFAPVRRRAPTPRRATKPRPKKRKR